MKRKANRIARTAKRKNRKRERQEGKIAFLKSLSPEDYQEYLEKNKGKKVSGTNVHHRHTRWTGGNSNPENLSRVSIREHNAYNLMFNDGHMHPTEIARKLTAIWIDPQWELTARRRDGKCVEEEHLLSDVSPARTPAVSQITAVEHGSSASGFPPQPKSCMNCTAMKLMNTLQPALTAFAQEQVARAFSTATFEA